MTYRITKTFGHDRGLSACFRQWRADSHCAKMHGYALSVQVVLEAATLDHRNWVYDFGNLKHYEKWLKSQFDHKTLVAEDDPHLFLFRELHDNNIIDLVILPRVGCESFARHCYTKMAMFLVDSEVYNRVRVVSVTVAEHGSNSATFIPGE